MTTPPIKTDPSTSIFQGAGKAGQEGCLLRVVTLSEIRKGLCGGMVGQGTTKICLSANCGVALHRNKYIEMSHFGSVKEGQPTEAVMVQDAKNPDVVLAEPWVPFSWVEDSWNHLKGDTRPQELWTNYLCTLLVSPEEADLKEALQASVQKAA